jgi:DNA-binding SARP family transcriptional activator
MEMYEHFLSKETIYRDLPSVLACSFVVRWRLLRVLPDPAKTKTAAEMSGGIWGAALSAEFCLLGDVEVSVDGKPVGIGYAQLQCTLAVLLVDVGRPVPVDLLVDRVWGDRRLPRRPRAAVQHNIALLRRALAAAEGVAIVRHPVGYQLAADAGMVDAHRFRALLREARAAPDDDRAAEFFGQALRLWRGEPCAGLESAWLDSVRGELAAERYAAQLDLGDIMLRQGRHAALLNDLAQRIAEYPLDERLAGQYLLALYRGGRQADALRHYDELRLRLADELGTDPSPPLRLLVQRILAGSPELLPSKPVPGSVSARVRVPHQLPNPPRLFTGRSRELAFLTAALGGPADPGATVAIGGVGGVGKTWLALHWAYQHLGRFPDGQLYANLRGFDPAGQPVTSASATRGFLHALGVDPAAVPADADEQAGLYRSLTCGRRLLIVLDNARDAAQVAPLLPGSPGCTVLVTSRHRLEGLAATCGARLLDVDILSPGDAQALLTQHLGQARVSAEPGAVAALLAGCAGLPLAISIVAARAAGRCGLTLTALAAEFGDESARLDALDAGEAQVSLGSVLSWSFSALSGASRAALGLLALAPGPDICGAAVPSLLATSPGTAHALLRELERACLVHQYACDRYRMHDLVRLAAAAAERDRSAAVQTAALRRLADFYLHTACGGHQVLNPQAVADGLDPPAAGCQPARLSDGAAAMAWFEAEHPCLLAVQEAAARQGWHPTVWHLAWTMEIFHLWQGRLRDGVAVWRAGLAAADHIADPAAQIVAHRFLGRALTRIGEGDEAVEHLRKALVMAARARQRTEQAHTHRTLALAWGRLGQDRRALKHASHALRLFQVLGNPVWEADALNEVGWFAMRVGDCDLARGRCCAALDIHLRQHNDLGVAATLDTLGCIAHRSGDLAGAVGHYRQALPLFESLGNAYERACTLDRLGESHAGLGQSEQAWAAWQEALRLYLEQARVREADRLRSRLAALSDRAAGKEPGSQLSLGQQL